eukprot:gene4984-6967_t
MDSGKFQIPKGYEDFVSNSTELFNEFHKTVTEDDTVSFHIYHLDRIGSIGIVEIIEEYEKIKSSISEICQAYIWHKKGIALYLSIEEEYMPIRGTIQYGENIEDEWFLVYVLLELSKRFLDRISISVTDADGQFLLIEACDHIPDWLAPENSLHRVWIKNGFINIIPIDEPGKTKDGIALHHALHYLKITSNNNNNNNNGIYENLELIQTIISKRTFDLYPNRIFACDHYATCIVTKRAAIILQQYPSLISGAVNAFNSSNDNNNNYDQILSNKTKKNKENYIKQMKIFGNNNNNNNNNNIHMNNIADKNQLDLTASDMTIINVRFTRALYAQLFFKPFHPPKKFHSLMLQLKGYQSLDVNKAFDIGCRICCGLEIAYHESLVNHLLYNNSNNNNMKNEKQNELYNKILTNELLQNEKELLKSFIFSNKIELKIEKKYFKDYNNNENFYYYTPYVIPLNVMVDNVIINESDNGNEVGTSLEKFLLNNNEKNIKNDSKVKLIDFCKNSESDSWLYLTPEEFDKEMNQRAQSAMEDIIEGVKSFLNGKSDISGIESNNSRYHSYLSDSQLKQTRDIKSSKSDEILEYNGLEIDNNKLNNIIESYDKLIFNVELSNNDNISSIGPLSEDELFMRNYLKTMENELFSNGSTLPNTFTGSTLFKQHNRNNTIESMDDVDIDLNLLSNILESQSFQMGIQSSIDPISQILANLKISLPQPPSPSDD